MNKTVKVVWEDGQERTGETSEIFRDVADKVCGFVLLLDGEEFEFERVPGGYVEINNSSGVVQIWVKA